MRTKARRLLRVSRDHLLIRGFLAATMCQCWVAVPEAVGAPAEPVVYNCVDFWSQDHLPDAWGESLSIPCREYEPANPSYIVGPGTPYRIFFTTQWDEYPRPGSRAFIEAVAAGLDASVRHYRRHLRIYPISVVVTERIAAEYVHDTMSPMDPYTRAAAYGDWVRFEEPCPVFTFATAFAPAEEIPGYTEQLISHEVFHCLQSAHFHDRMGTKEETAWWVEGTAVYFSHAVFPCVNSEHGHSRSYSPTFGILEQDYENVAFYQHLAETGRVSEEGILRLIRSLPSDHSRPAHLRALASYPGIEDHFHEFGRAYLDDSIPDCGGGGIMPVSREPGELVEIAESGELEIEAQPFALGRVRFKLAPGRSYRLRVDTREGTGRLSLRPAGQIHGWRPVPETVDTPCEGEATFQLLATTAPATDTPYRVSVDFISEANLTAGSCAECVDTGVYDRCLVGTWRVRPEDMAAWLRSVYGRSTTTMSGIELKSHRIAARLVAGRDGTAVLHLDELELVSEIRQRIAGRDAAIPMTLAGRGDSLHSWSTENGEILHICPREDNIRYESTIVVGGQSFTQPVPPFEGFLAGRRYEYRCSGGHLTTTFRPPGGLPPQIYHWEKDD